MDGHPPPVPSQSHPSLLPYRCPGWTARFDVWPYLERFALDVETEVLVEMGGKPDLIIGNYR